MGHYYAEMFQNGQDIDFERSWAEYQKDRAQEIKEIISRNPIKFEEIVVGDRINLYSPLKGWSKIHFREDPPEKIRAFFERQNFYYKPGLWMLFAYDDFTIYDKNERDNTLRISKPPKGFLDMFPAWIYFRYFEK
jgi:hypothetical protein